MHVHTAGFFLGAFFLGLLAPNPRQGIECPAPAFLDTLAYTYEQLPNAACVQVCYL